MPALSLATFTSLVRFDFRRSRTRTLLDRKRLPFRAFELRAQNGRISCEPQPLQWSSL
jgi:hypothetical protein